MAVKLHRCPGMWAKFQGHPCWRVQTALDEAGIEYEIVKDSYFRGRRTETMAKTGGKLLPWIEFEDGSVLREESKDMAARIRTGNLRPPMQPAAEAAPTFAPPSSE